MSTKRYAAPLCLEPRRSARLALLFVLAVSGAILLPLFVPLPWWLRSLAMLAVGAVAVPAWRGALGRGRIARAVWDETGAWQLTLADGAEFEVELAGETFVTPEAMVLAFRSGRRNLHLVVLADSLDAVTRRRLRVRLRLEGGGRAQAGQGTAV